MLNIKRILLPVDIPSTGAELDPAQHVADRQLLHARFFYVRIGPNRALGLIEHFCWTHGYGIICAVPIPVPSA